MTHVYHHVMSGNDSYPDEIAFFFLFVKERYHFTEFASKLN